MKNIKVMRLSIQVIALFLQIYFIVETVRLHTCGYVLFMGKPIGNEWFSMLFTLLTVVACEMISIAEAIIFTITRINIYSIAYIALVIVNAVLFMTMAYYSMVGTIICLSFYGVLFVIRVVNLILNLTDVIKDLRTQQ